MDSHAPKEHRGKVEVVEPPKPPSPKPLSISEAQKLGVTYQGDDWLEKMYEAEAKAAVDREQGRGAYDVQQQAQAHARTGAATATATAADEPD